tara:strand:- start:271 stop:618 length:348 start_codon:yes stop_codon:yes gene_type:complete
MPYRDDLCFNDIEYLNLFDNIPYRYVKNIIKNNKDDDDKYERILDCEIEDMEAPNGWTCKKKITFEIECDVSGGSLTIMRMKKFIVELEYNGSSPTAMYIGENMWEDEDEDEEEE